jgi:hypothetical protein
MVNNNRLDDPAVLGFVTTTGITSGRAIKYEGTVTVIDVGLILIGNKTALPKLTTAPFSKLEPLIVSVNDSDLDATELGDNEEIIGAVGREYSLTLNASVTDIPPPG